MTSKREDGHGGGTNINHRPATLPPFSETWKLKSPSGYQISEHLLNHPNPSRPNFKIVLVGAGPSGIDCLHFARQELEESLRIELVCFEKNADVGGTWFENRYVRNTISSISHSLLLIPAWPKFLY
jgi:hypothetical protein